MVLEPGQVIGGKYALLERVGEGGFGVVWSARRADGRKVAVKFLHANLSPDTTRRFRREAEILARLDHAHCVGCHDFDPGGPGRSPWLVTAFVAGITLDDWIGPERSPRECLEVVEQIAKAVDAAHRAGVIHRDLKPGNIIVEERLGRPHVTVLDFGIGKLLDEHRTDVTVTGEVIGTPGYMSPEQLRGSRDIGPRSDLYALGALIYRIFEHEPVFKGRTPLGISMQHLTKVPPRTINAPAPVADLVARLLAKEPGDRPANMGAVLAVLRPSTEPLGEERTDHVRGVDPTTANRSPIPAIVAIVAIVVVLGAAAILLGRGRNEPVPVDRVLPTALTRPEAAPVPTHLEAGSPACAEKSMVEPGWRPVEGGRLYVPRGFKPQRQHSVVVLVRTDDPDAYDPTSGFERLADRDAPVLLAEPNIGPTTRTLAPFVEQVGAVACIDADRVYFVGVGAASQLLQDMPVTDELAAAAIIDERVDPDALKARQKSPLRPVIPTYLFTSQAMVDRVELAASEQQLRWEHRCDGASLRTHEFPDRVCRTWTCETELSSCVFAGGAAELSADPIWAALSEHRRRPGRASEMGLMGGCGRVWEPGEHEVGDSIVVVPQGYGAQDRHPVIFVLHGNHESQSETLDIFEFRRLADEHEILIAAPRGPPKMSHSRRSWGWLGANSNLWEAVDDVRTSFCTDPGRTYLFGHTGSGTFTETVRDWDEFAAVATFSHRPSPKLPDLNHAVARPYLSIISTGNPTEPVTGTDRVMSVADNQARLVAEHSCVPGARRVVKREGRATCWAWTDCAAPLEICEVTGDRWPAPARDSLNEWVLLDFFERHRR